jgi:S1-C subfamily serine protease
MLRKISFAAAGLLATHFGLSDANAQRAVTPQGGTPPISRTETRPNLGPGAYRSTQDSSVRGGTSTDAGVGSTATGSRIGARAGSRVGFGATFDDGVINDLIIDQVTAGSPAALAGLRSGDTIVSINDRRFRDQQQASSFLRGFQGDRLTMSVLRDGSYIDVTANTAASSALNSNRPAARTNATANSNTSSTARHDFGINDALGFGVRLGATDDGIVVREVARNSLASQTGIRPGDRLISLAGRNVNDSAAVNEILSGIGRDPTLDVVVARDGQPVDLTANLARYTGYYSTVDHSRGGTVDTVQGTRRFGDANLAGFQSVLGATFAQDANGNMTVSRIAPNSYAAELGLQRGDVMFGSNGQPIADAQGLMQFFSTARPGSEFGVDVLREGQQVPLSGNFDQAYYNELNTLYGGTPLSEDAPLEEKAATTNQPSSRTAMRDSTTQQPGTSRFDDGINNNQFNDSTRADGVSDPRQIPRSPSGNPYRQPSRLGNPGNDQRDSRIRERLLNQGQLNQGQLDQQNNRGGVFDDSNTNRSFHNNQNRRQANEQSTRIDTPRAQEQLNATEELRESFLRGQAEAQGQNAGANGQQRPGSLGNRPRTGGNRGTGVLPRGRGTATQQDSQVQGGAQGGVQGGAPASGGASGATRGGATGGGGAAGSGGGRR